MKLLFLLLIFLHTIVLPMKCITLCEKGCTCSSDSTCEYYCRDRHCQDRISYGSRCRGYDVHPRECGLFKFCDSDSNQTCQQTKSNGVMCKYNRACDSNYCDLSLQTCQENRKSNSKPIYIILPCIGAGIFVLCLILSTTATILSVRKRRINANYQANEIVIGTFGNYPIVNSAYSEDSPPPAYSQVIAAGISSNKTGTEH